MKLTSTTQVVITTKGISRLKQRKTAMAIIWAPSQRVKWVLQDIWRRGARGMKVSNILKQSDSYLTRAEARGGLGFGPISRYSKEEVMKTLNKLLSSGFIRIRK